MMKKLLSILLSLALLLSLAGCLDLGVIGGADGPTKIFVASADGSTAPADTETQADSTTVESELSTEDTESPIDADGWYYSVEDVSLYLHTYGCLPENFITKSEAQDMGWEGGSVEDYAPGYAIGGDVFGNREGLLPDADGRTYYECDIDTNGSSSRGAKRIVFSNDGLIYYTDDHYESFTLLYGEE